MKRYLFLSVATMIGVSVMSVRGQGFVNLDFEDANLASHSPGMVSVADAIPGWTALSNGLPVSTIAYDVPGSIEIVEAGTIQRDYHVHLEGRRGLQVSIGQTAAIPASSRSLLFWGYWDLGTVSFDGEELSLVELGKTASYNIYGCGVSAFAGQTGQLLFSTTGTAVGDIDDIQFSPAMIAEPAPGAILAVGLAAIAFSRFAWQAASSRACLEGANVNATNRE